MWQVTYSSAGVTTRTVINRDVHTAKNEGTGDSECLHNFDILEPVQ